MMDLLAPLGMALHVLAMLLFRRAAVPALRRARAAWAEDAAQAVLPAPQAPPSLALIVPFTGDGPAVRAGLESLLRQDGWRYTAFLAVRGEDDPAADLARELMRRFPHASLVVAGEATRCCQKNHSLLAAIRAAGEAPEILVFCDSGHEARPDFLTRLTRPLLSGEAQVASTYHHVLPASLNPASLFHFFASQLVHMLQSLPGSPLLWGGATAIRRDVFLRHGVDAIWATGVVDDFLMGPHLLRRGVAAAIAPDAATLTRLAPQSLAGWWSWWFRQLHYMKFCLPPVWLAVTLAPLGGAALLAYSIADVLSGGLYGWAYGLSLSAVGAGLGALCLRPIPPWKAGLAYVGMLILTIPCYLATWLTNTLRWRGVAYRARLDGTVAEIRRS